MNINNIIFTDSLPSLDLHGLDEATAVVYIKDFINDNLKMHNEFIMIIHGKGSGILRNATNNTLRRNNNIVKDYKLCYPNMGCTIVQLNIDLYKNK